MCKKDVVEQEDYLKTLFNKVLENINDFKSVQQTFKSFYNEQNKHYTLNLENKSVLLAYIKAKNIFSEEVCSFISDIYYIIKRAFMFTNLCMKHSSSSGNEVYCENARDMILNIRIYFLTIIKYGSRNHILLKMSYYIITVLFKLMQHDINYSDQ